MKIAIVAPEVFPVPPIRGGAVENGIEELSSHLSDHEVHIFGIADPLLPAYEEKGHRIYYRYAKGLFDKALLSSWKLPFKKSHSKWYYWPYCQWVSEKIKKLAPDVLWVHSRMHFVPWLRQVAPKAKLILSIHNENNLEGRKVWTEEAIDACDALTGVSRWLVEEMVSRYPSCRDKAVVLYNGVNPEIFRPVWEIRERELWRRERGWEDALVILFVGRLVEVKGVHLLIEAFTSLSKQIPQARLVIIGSHTFSDARTTPHIARLRKLAEGLEDKINFEGYVSRNKIARYYAMSDIVAFPSIWKEPFAQVVLEAMASSLPVVAFKKGGQSEIIQNGKNGLLVPEAEGASGLTEALRYIIQEPALRGRIGDEARRSVESHWTWKRMAGSFVTLCETLFSSTKYGREVVHV